MPKRKRTTPAQKAAAKRNLEAARKKRLGAKGDSARIRARSLTGHKQNAALKKARGLDHAALGGKPVGKKLRKVRRSE